MSEQPLLSVVVPAYGVAPYIADCLWSILRQPVESMEVIVVDDASPDTVAAIVRDIASEDPRVRLISHPRNRGLGAARNTGLDAARGQFITFPDSDDLVARDAYPRMVDSLERSGSDFVTGPAEEFGKGRQWYWTTAGRCFDVRRTRTSLTDIPELIHDHTAWNKVYRRDFLMREGIRWPEGVKCEDVVPSAHAYVKARSIDVLPEPVYYYRRRAGSITTNLGGDVTVSDWATQQTQAAEILAGETERVRAAFAEKVVTRELLSAPRLAALTVGDALLVQRVGELVAALVGWLDKDALARLEGDSRWAIAAIAGRSPDALRIVRDRTALEAVDTVTFGLLPEPLLSSLALGQRSPKEAFHARFGASNRFSSYSRQVLRDYDGDPEISVVVPTHNVDTFVGELLWSLRRATDVRLEFIVVDDNSTDRTWEIVQRHASEDCRIRALRLVGRGGGQARNIGVELARGRYIAFADGDDIVPRFAYRAMLELAEKTGSDVTTGSYVKLFTTSTWGDPRRWSYDYELHGTSLADHPLLVRQRTCWNRLFRREFWESSVFPFPSVPRANDIVPMVSAMARAASISVLPETTYIYRNRPGSGSMTARLGTTASTVSYFAEEVSCAQLLRESSSETQAQHWYTMLSVDGWPNLGKYLDASRDQHPEPELARVLDELAGLIPEKHFRAATYEQQAVWGLVFAGELRHARVLHSASRNIKIGLIEVIDAVRAAAAIESLSSRSLMRLRWKYVTRRLIEERTSVTYEIAAAAVSLFREHVPGSDIAVPGAAEDLLITALHTANPHEILRVLEDQARQPSARLSVTRHGLRLEGEVRAGSRRYLGVSASPGGADKQLRIPVARITTSADGRTWSALVDRERFPRSGRWHISLDIEDDWGLRRPALRIAVHPDRDRFRRIRPVVAASVKRESAQLLVRQPIHRRMLGTVMRRLAPLTRMSTVPREHSAGARLEGS